jgi:hypothetical protein
MSYDDFFAIIEAGYNRKGLKWINGDVVRMTPQEYDNYLREVPLPKAGNSAISDLRDLGRSKVEAQHQ